MHYFVPSDEIPPLRILANALASVPPSVARAAIEAHTQPGDVILDPFCAGVGVIQTALELNRKIIAASFNPIAILAIEATLW
ncbi:MAG TPA: DNA methyltransferase, partial [Anaerolineae bacterium]|nr:DNA methyltransferase [Anaerolineae bacterium]